MPLPSNTVALYTNPNPHNPTATCFPLQEMTELSLEKEPMNSGTSAQKIKLKRRKIGESERAEYVRTLSLLVKPWYWAVEPPLAVCSPCANCLYRRCDGVEWGCLQMLWVVLVGASSGPPCLTACTAAASGEWGVSPYATPVGHVLLFLPRTPDRIFDAFLYHF